MDESINTLAAFCGVRDIPTLDRAHLQQRYGIDQADVMVLFGGSILCGGDVLAEAMRQQVAQKYIIVGGAGHTTQTLREIIHQKYPAIETADKPEAIIFNEYLQKKYGLMADAIEIESTNCGNNITRLLDLLEAKQIPCTSIILTQDATMQRRMSATLRKYKPEWTMINYAAYQAHVEVRDGCLCFTEPIEGMWDMERYISLLLGEIPRLTDDQNGYGPRGKSYIAHEEIPSKVEAAFVRLTCTHSALVRQADPQYADKNQM